VAFRWPGASKVARQTCPDRKHHPTTQNQKRDPDEGLCGAKGPSLKQLPCESPPSLASLSTSNSQILS
jgi:hypothetical protein